MHEEEEQSQISFGNLIHEKIFVLVFYSISFQI